MSDKSLTQGMSAVPQAIRLPTAVRRVESFLPLSLASLPGSPFAVGSDSPYVSEESGWLIGFFDIFLCSLAKGEQFVDH